MKTFLGILLGLTLGAAPLAAQTPPDFDKYYLDQTMRIDYFHIGNLKEETVTLDRAMIQGTWAGSTKNLLDPFDLGKYAVEIYDAASGTLIFSRGFDSYFGEYRTTEEAANGIRRTYHESALIPRPKAPIKFVFKSRDGKNVLQTVFEQVIDPASIEVLKKPLISGVKVFELHKSGDPHVKVDVAFIPEGYTAAEEGKLRADLERFAAVFLNRAPYRDLKDKFNLVCAWKPSDDSGCDEPSHGSYKSTAVSARFDSLGSERYILTEDNKALRDIASHVPYDALYIMVNHKRYGGGGIYNSFCTFTTDNMWSNYIFLHEFGHSFTGLADEYYTSEVAYNEFYPAGVEPREANITALLDPKNVKWKDLLTPGIPIPTPWEKEEFDKSDLAYQLVRRALNKKIAELKRSGAPAEEIAKASAEYDEKSAANAAWVDKYLASSKFAGMTGAFEGAGYAAKGLYRSAADCLMFTIGDKPLCRVCEAAVRRMILFYAE